MKGVRAAVRYAKALRQLAEEKNLFDTVIADVKLIRNTIEENRELKLVLRNPLVEGDKKRNILTSIFSGKLNEITLNFIQLVIDHNRERILLTICEEFIHQYNEIYNIAKVSVTSTLPLSNELKEELIQKLKAAYQFSEVELEEKIDKDLIGGFILRMGDKQLDASIRRQLNDIKQELIHA